MFHVKHFSHAAAIDGVFGDNAVGANIMVIGVSASMVTS